MAGPTTPDGFVPDGFVPDATTTDTQNSTTSAANQPSWLSTAMKFGEGVLSNVNPIEITKGIYGAVAHPIDTVEGLGKAQVEQFQKAKDAYDQGRYSEALGHTLAGVLPIVGPQAANVGEAIGAGGGAYDVGRGVGLAATMAPGALADAAGTVAGVARGTQAASAVADAADASAAAKMAQAIRPTVGANKLRFANMAEAVAPRLAADADLSALSRSGLGAKVASKLEDAGTALDAAADARLKGRPIETQPIVDALQQKVDALTAQPFNAMRVKVQAQPVNSPFGAAVVPPENAAQVARLQQGIADVKALGPQASYDALKTIRQAADKSAKVKYAPSITQDFLAKSGESSGAADVAGALRDTLGAADPATASANADYAFWRKANDVIQAAEETDRARPTVGRTIMSRAIGGLVGDAAGGKLSAAIGLIAGPAIDSAASSVSLKIPVARALASLSSAIRTGDPAAFSSAAARLRALSLIRSAQANQAQQP